MHRNKGIPLPQQPWKGTCWVSYSWEQNGQQSKWLHSEIPHCLWSNHTSHCCFQPDGTQPARWGQSLMGGLWLEDSLPALLELWYHCAASNTFLPPSSHPPFLSSKSEGSDLPLGLKVFPAFFWLSPHVYWGFFSINLISSNPTTVPVTQTTVTYTCTSHKRKSEHIYFCKQSYFKVTG